MTRNQLKKLVVRKVRSGAIGFSHLSVLRARAQQVDTENPIAPDRKTKKRGPKKAASVLLGALQSLGSPITCIKIPMRTGRGQNDRGHWAILARRARTERMAVHQAWPAPWRQVAWSLPLCVALTRVSPGTRPLDSHDNLRGALKHVVDAIAMQLGLDDGDPRITWLYQQRRGPWAVEITIGSVVIAV